MVFILNILLQFTARGKENETLELLYQEHIQESLEIKCNDFEPLYCHCLCQDSVVGV